MILEGINLRKWMTTVQVAMYILWGSWLKECLHFDCKKELEKSGQKFPSCKPSSRFRNILLINPGL